MRESRFDPLRRRWILYAAERAERPNDYRQAAVLPGGGPCPFCPGNEHETPPEIQADRPRGSPPNGPGWTLRVVPNRFPAAVRDAPETPPVAAPFLAAPAFGAHEVVIETERHDLSLASFEPRRLLRLLQVFRERVAALAGEERFAHVIVFRNTGPRSGASLVHPHTQILAMPRLGATMEAERESAREHAAGGGGCLSCALVRAERADGRRLLGARGGALAYVPYASRFPAETVITPAGHPEPFARCPDALLEDAAGLLGPALARLARAFRDPSYNLTLHGHVTAREFAGGHHWRIEVLPRLAQYGGFEIGTGCFISSLAPEGAAAALRGE